MQAFPDHAIKLLQHRSGIRFISVAIPHYPVSISSVWIAAGSRYDPKGKEGLSHLFEHLLGTKTKNYPDRQKRIVEVEREGFTYNAITTKETQLYFYMHSSEKTKRAVDLLVDGIWSSQFSSEDILEEKEVVNNEERDNFHDPASYIWRLADRGLWEGKDLAQDLYGSKESRASIEKHDFEAFQKHMFVPEKMTFILINSNMSDEEILSLPLQDFTLQGKEIIGKNDKLRQKAQVKGHFIFEYRETDSVQIALSFLTDALHDEKETMLLSVVRDYLASGWMSRLIQRLRVEKKLTYWVSGETRDYRNSGYIRFTFSLQPNNLEEALKIFEEEIHNLKSKEIPKRILEDHIYKHKSDIIRQSVDPDSLLWWYGWYSSILLRRPQTVDEYIKALDNIEPLDIQKICRKYFIEENFSLALVGKEQLKIKMPTFQ